MNITAVDIKKLLYARAESQCLIYFEEVTDYARRVGGRQSRIDALLIKPAYSKLQLWGYEIKVSRRDFVADEKWHQYLEMCNNLYFICPHGVIGKDEVPAEAGLIYVFKNGAGMRTVKKAPYRDVTYRPEYFLGMIINKLGLLDRTEVSREQRIEEALRRSRLEADALILGREMGSKLAWALSEQREKQERIEQKLEELADVRDFLRKEGIIVDTSGRRTWNNTTALERLIARKDKIIQDPEVDRLINSMRQVENSLERLKGNLDKARDDANTRADDARQLF